MHVVICREARIKKWRKAGTCSLLIGTVMEDGEQPTDPGLKGPQTWAGS